MVNSWLTDFLFLSICLVAVHSIAVANQRKAQKLRNQGSQKCDLICPGQPALTLPPNFIQNCTSVGNNSSTATKTTARPSKTTTTESGENESTESGETDNQNSTARMNKHQRIHNSDWNPPNSNLKMLRVDLSQTAPFCDINNLLAKNHRAKKQSKHRLKKETIIFTRKAKSRLFKHHQHLKEKARLDGCYVICSEESGIGTPPENEPDSEESDSSDNYVDGEDTPIEIIYIPQQIGEDKRPSELYQINNYELVPPQPVFEFGYDSPLIEGNM